MLSHLTWIEHAFGTRHSTFPEERLAKLKQIHSATVIVVDRPGHAGVGDALITDRPGILLSVRTADCLPILIADTRRRVVAAVHAGWRGTAAAVVVAALRAMGARAEDVEVAIGPGIGACCYEVGPEVARHFPGQEGSRRIDLAAENRRQLLAAGVLEQRIRAGSPCTFCTPELFHSWRRDGPKAGRMFSVIGVATGQNP